MTDIDTFVDSGNDSFTDNNGQTRQTLTGIENEITQQLLEINKSRGYRVVGTFAAGFEYELFNDVGIDANGNSWVYVGAGAPAKTVTAGTVPSAPDYQQVTYANHDTLQGRDSTNSHPASAIQSDSGKSLQAIIGESTLDWDSSVTYSTGDTVKFGGKEYKAKSGNSNKQPDTNFDVWDINGYWFQTGKNQSGNVLDAVNVIGGHSKNAIVPDTHSCVIGGGGLTNKENVIGGVEANVNTENSNIPESWTLGDESQFCYIGGGYDNVVNGLANVIPVGQHCLVSRNADHGTVTGGSVNWILEGSYNSIYGGSRNEIYSDGYSVITGGGDNYIGTVSTNSTISGGSANQVYASFTAISGGQTNIAYSGADTSAIAGGSGNKVRQANSTISGGNGNEIQSTGQGSTIIGGISNRGNGQCSTVLGGRENFAEKDYSVASGYQSEVSVQGQQVFANGKFTSQGDAQASRLILKGSTAGLQNNVVLQGINNLSNISTRSQIAIGYKITLVAHETSNNGENAMIILEGLAHRGTSGSWQIVPLPDRSATTTNTASVSAEVYDATGELRVRVNGASGQSLNWVALCEYVENRA